MILANSAFAEWLYQDEQTTGTAIREIHSGHAHTFLASREPFIAFAIALRHYTLRPFHTP